MRTKKRKFIFLANATVGHTNFLISLALKAKENGSEVMFMLPGLTNKTIRKFINDPSLNIDSRLKNYSIPYKLIPLALIQGVLGAMLPHKSGLNEVLFASKVLSAGSKQYTRFLMNEFLKERPDVIVYDYTFFPAIAISEKLQIPRVAIYHSGLPFLEYPIPPIGFAFKYGAYSQDKFNNLRQLILKMERTLKLKYEKIIKQTILTNFILSPNSNFLNIINTIKEAEYPRNNLTDNILFTGPSIQATSDHNENPFFDKKDKKLIYISLGTVFNKNSELFIKIINSIKYEVCEILVAAGASYNKLKEVSFDANVHIEKFVPQVNVLYQADVFITHGGKNSINEALKIGVPMILFPVGGEQQYNAQLVEFINTGIDFGNIRDSFTAQQLTEAIERLLGDKTIVSSVKKLSEKHQNSDGAIIAYDEISQKLQTFYDKNSKNT
jgi:MGT family glycosyltransferase